MRMILVRHRRTEQGKDSVACRLNNVAAIVIHRVDHQMQRRIDDSARLFGIELFHKIHRAFDIGEEGGNRLSFLVGRISYGSLGRYPNSTPWRYLVSWTKRRRSSGLKSGAALSAKFE